MRSALKNSSQLASFLSLSILVGCATVPSDEALRVRDADETVVAGCRFLGQVQGSSGWGGLAASAGMENSKTEARQRAASLGASHIVWQAVTGGYSPYASGRAYACD